MPSRRKVLVTGAASAVIIGGGLFAYDIFSPSLSQAQEPWRAAAEGFGDARLDILAYAILAPNPHNRQPWIIELIGDDRIRLTADLDRMLPQTDPPNRQITIGFGAFLELLRIAAAEKGYRAEIMPFPQGEPQPVLDARPIADIRLVAEPGIAKDPLFEAVLDRRTNREHYDPTPIEDRQFSALRIALPQGDGVGLGWANDAGGVNVLKEIATDAWLIEYETPRTLQESIDLMRIGADEANINPDGIILDGPLMEAAYNLGIVTREKLADPGSYAFAEGISMYTSLIDASPSMVWLHTPDNSRVDQLATGAAWVRLQLAATRQSLAMQPLSQVLQEFPEMAEQYQRLHDHLGIEAPSRIQGLFRIGRAAPVPPSPRWSLASRLIDA
jgi:Nitroreductase family